MKSIVSGCRAATSSRPLPLRFSSRRELTVVYPSSSSLRKYRNRPACLSTSLIVGGSSPSSSGGSTFRLLCPRLKGRMAAGASFDGLVSTNPTPAARHCAAATASMAARVCVLALASAASARACAAASAFNSTDISSALVALTSGDPTDVAPLFQLRRLGRWRSRPPSDRLARLRWRAAAFVWRHRPQWGACAPRRLPPHWAQIQPVIGRGSQGRLRCEAGSIAPRGAAGPICGESSLVAPRYRAVLPESAAPNSLEPRRPAACRRRPQSSRAQPYGIRAGATLQAWPLAATTKAVLRHIAVLTATDPHVRWNDTLKEPLARRGAVEAGAASPGRMPQCDPG
eukprot:scaffold63954_cov23-Tisochrysis_lutea.AAC.2